MPESMGRKSGGATGWAVIVKGRVIDTVFFDADMDADTVRRSLIDHDGYDASLTVKRGR